ERLPRLALAAVQQIVVAVHLDDHVHAVALGAHAHARLEAHGLEQLLGETLARAREFVRVHVGRILLARVVALAVLPPPSAFRPRHGIACRVRRLGFGLAPRRHGLGLPRRGQPCRQARRHRGRGARRGRRLRPGTGVVHGSLGLGCCGLVEHRAVVTVQDRSLRRSGGTFERIGRTATTTAASPTATTTALARSVVALVGRPCGAGDRRGRRGRPRLGCGLQRVRIPRGTRLAPAFLTDAVFVPTLFATAFVTTALTATTLFAPWGRRPVTAGPRCPLRGGRCGLGAATAAARARALAPLLTGAPSGRATRGRGAIAIASAPPARTRTALLAARARAAVRLATALRRAPATAARAAALFAHTPATATLLAGPLAGLADRSARPARHAHAIRSRADAEESALALLDRGDHRFGAG